MEQDDNANTETSANSCCVCFMGVEEGNEQWTCGQCQTRTHLRCVLQWVLRLSLNSSGTPHTFTCPTCRHGHSISSLPGFQGEEIEFTARIPNPAPAAPHAIMSILTHMFPNPRERPLPVPVASSTSGHGTRMEDPVVHDIEEHEIVDDDDDDDDDELSSHPAIHIKSREFTISIQSLTINYR